MSFKRLTGDNYLIHANITTLRTKDKAGVDEVINNRDPSVFAPYNDLLHFTHHHPFNISLSL